MSKIGIIIINYNAPDDTLACIQSVEKYAGKLNPTLLIYDNSDLTLFEPTVLSGCNLDFRYHKNKTNNGFSGAVNQGLKVLKEEGFTYFFLLNNDVLLVDYSLRKMLACLEQNASISIVGGINYYFNKPNQIWQSGFKNNWLTGSVKQLTPSESFFKVDYVPGSTLLGRIELVGRVGYFDEQFFHYFEENDYCYRTAKAGGEVVVLSDTRFLHKADGRDRKDSPFIFYYMTRNQLLFLSKHRNFLRLIIPTIYLHLYNLMRALKYDIISEKWSRFVFLRVYIKATRDFWIGKRGQNKDAFP